ncbi:MAG: hypothetical protein DDT40_01203 [candidate division WS2 bacterium]|nr:hypothetical protein [Candidatus Psychracetigena formicireducens]
MKEKKVLPGSPTAAEELRADQMGLNIWDQFQPIYSEAPQVIAFNDFLNRMRMKYGQDIYSNLHRLNEVEKEKFFALERATRGVEAGLARQIIGFIKMYDVNDAGEPVDLKTGKVMTWEDVEKLIGRSVRWRES